MPQMLFQESKKNGCFRGLQLYKCLDCNHIFNNKRRDHKTNISRKIWQDYIDHNKLSMNSASSIQSVIRLWKNT